MGFSSPTVGQRPAAESAARPQSTGDLQELIVEVGKLRFFSPDTGFFVIDALALGQMPPPPDEFAQFMPSSNRVAVKGESMMFSRDMVGETIKVHGNWAVDPAHGIQFQSCFIQEVIPTNLEGLTHYLSSGTLPGIGPGVAAKIIDTWGMGALDIIEKTPAELSKIPGITSTRAAAIGAAWQAKKDEFELMAFFGQYGIGEANTRRIIAELGTENLKGKVKENPYLITVVDGVGFKTADQMAMAMGFDPSAPERADAALDHVLSEKVSQDGNTAVPMDEWKVLSMQYLNYPGEHIDRAIERLLSSGKVVERTLPVVRHGGSPVPVRCVSPKSMARSENTIAKRVMALAHASISEGAFEQARFMAKLSDPASPLDPSQRAAALRMFSNCLSVMTGGPGTGKTTTLKTFVVAMVELGKSVVLAAPTGRAAKRMEEAIGMPAATMHRCLGYKPSQGFDFNAHNPMAGDVFILDEASMVDTQMACAWLDAVPPGAKVIFVGDADQLPSVGAGDVLRDIMACPHVPVARLTRIHRQAAGSGIARAAQIVLSGRAPISGDYIGTDFFFEDRKENHQIVDEVKRIIAREIHNGVAPMDIQVLCPQKNGEAGTLALNEELRWLLNPYKPDPDDEDVVETHRGWRIGDRLMQTRNNYDLDVFNGDMGTLEDIDADGGLLMKMEDGREVKFSKKETLGLVMGYAITVHKSQGGEKPVIIMPISPAHTFSLNKNLVYTGITRGKARVHLVGSSRTAVIAAQKTNQNDRITGLSEELRLQAAPPSPPRARMA